MTTGGGFEYGPDNESVVARLSIDVPTEGVQSMRELTTETHKFQVEMEATGRMTKDFLDYLKQLPAIQKQVAEAQKALVTQLERTITTQKEISQGLGGQPSSGVPGGPAQNPWADVTSGMGTRPANRSDAANQLGRTDMRSLLVAAETKGGLRVGDMPTALPDEDQLADIGDRQVARDAATQNQQTQTQQTLTPPTDRVPTTPGKEDVSAKNPREDEDPTAKNPREEQRKKNAQTLDQKAKLASSLLNPVMNEMGAGGSTEGMLGALASGARGLGGLLGGSGGALGAIGSALTNPVTAALGVAGAGLYAFEKGGNVVEGWRQMGQQRGGGWQEGLGYEMNVRAMAMNPFITTDQARKIVQGALSEGYSGKEYDTVLEFVSGNLKAMNMDISQQFQVLRKSVMEGGATVEGTRLNLQQQQALSKEGYLTSPERQEDWTRAVTAFTNMGIPGPLGQQYANNATQMWSGDQSLRGTGVSLAESMQDPKFAIMATHLAGVNMPGVLPEAIPLKLMEQGIDPTQIGEGMLKKWAQQALAQTNGDVDNATALFLRRIRRLAPNLKNQDGQLISQDITLAKKMLLSLTGQKDPYQESVEDNQQQQQQATAEIEERSLPERIGANIVGAGAAFFGGLADVVTGRGNITNRIPDESYGTAPAHIPAMDQIVKQYGVKGIQVQDGSGEWVPFKPTDRGQLEGLASGKYKYRPSGSDSEGTTLANTTQQVTNNYNTNTYNPGNANSQVQGTLNINVNPSQFQQALGVPQQIKLSPNQVQANMGYGSATTNSPPPGYNPPGFGR